MWSPRHASWPQHLASCSSTSYDVPCANPQSTDARESGPLPFKLPVDTDVKTELWVTDAGTLPVPALPLPTGGGLRLLPLLP